LWLFTHNIPATIEDSKKSDRFTRDVKREVKSEVKRELTREVHRKNPPPPGGFPIYYVPSSRTVCKRTPLEEFVPGSSRGVLLLTVLDEDTK